MFQDGVDPDSCNNVHVTDVLIDVGDDAVSVKSGLHWKTKKKVAASNYLFERVTILHRNFAIGSDVSGDVLNITFRDSIIGDDLGSSPWAIKLKTDSQEGGLVDGIRFLNLTIGNITFCGSSAFVYNPPHSTRSSCTPGHEKKATMIDVGMGYVGAKTNPGRDTNIIFEGLRGIGPTGASMSAHGVDKATGCPTCNEHIVNITLKDIEMETGGPWLCNDVDGLVRQNVKRWPEGSTCGGK